MPLRLETPLVESRPLSTRSGAVLMVACGGATCTAEQLRAWGAGAG